MSTKKVLMLPMAGYGRRFQTDGYALPKQFLRIYGVTCLEYSLRSIDLDYFDQVIVGCREEFERQYDVKSFLSSKFPTIDFEVVEFEGDTKGSLDTIYEMLVQKDVNSDSEVAIFTLDVNFTATKAFSAMETDAEVLVVRTNNPGFSYVKVNNERSMSVVRAAEKKVISDFGAVGLYRFKSAGKLMSLMQEELAGEPNFGGEYFICPLYNRYIRAGLTVKAVEAERMLMFGTPTEYEFCRSLRQTSSKYIAVSADHSGYEAKTRFINLALSYGYKVDDFGCYSPSPCDYDDFVYPAAQSVVQNRNDFSVSFCRSGQGVSISGSAVKGIRSILVYDPQNGLEIALKHNAPNHFSIPSHLADDAFLKSFFDALSSTEFEGGRHQDRLTKVLKHEKK